MSEDNQAVSLSDHLEQLDERLTTTEQSFWVTPREVDVPFPDSLNQVKLTFAAKTEQQAETEAELHCAPKQEQRESDINDDYFRDAMTVQSKIAELETDTELQKQKLYQQRDEAKSAILTKLYKNNMRFSSVATDLADYMEDKFQAKEDIIDDKRDAEHEVLTNKLTSLGAVRDALLASANEVNELEIASAKQIILDDDAEKQDAVTKYNNQVEEDEQKFQQSRTSAIHNAELQEQERAYEMIKNKITLGGTAFNNMVLSQKFEVCKAYLDTLSKVEALALMQMNDTLQNHLGSMYGDLEDYVNARSE